MYNGSCLCGKVKYQILSALKNVTNCHCSMCQKQHGAAFATYASVPINDFFYVAGEEALSSYTSSDNVVRKFCGNCGSNIEWRSGTKFPDWVSIAIASLDVEFEPKSVKNIFVESKMCW
ncbi:GFA family protein [Catenovulum sp. SX2]|uniref:GFA family protein n=1 Tax=Catenovulum sp. SX2 TaxID=3398614 RepID=UPI003F82E7D3